MNQERSAREIIDLCQRAALRRGHDSAAPSFGDFRGSQKGLGPGLGKARRLKDKTSGRPRL